MKLHIELDVKNKIEAFKIVNRISYQHKVKNATFSNKKYSFTNIKKPRHFLREDFDKIK